MRAWISVRIEPSVNAQIVTDALFAFGSGGVHETDGALVSHFPHGTSIEDLSRAITLVDPSAVISCTEAPPVDWSAWRANVSAHRIGRLTIAPPWLADRTPASETIIIEPAMAFGTGEHATTRGVVRLMQQLSPMPAFVADLGAGSAVLAIAAARLGAERVIAIELDPDAIGNAEENVAANRLSERVHVMEGDAATLLPLLAPVPLILANILSSVLLEMLSVIGACVPTGGHAILSGILVEERASMIAAFPSAGFEITAEDTEEGWWSVLLSRK
ncbi:MAG TPA: 50S ribosomal protein L11 methyltransferase [Gemmatimonadaceae bacterium]|nr:50S ribosomal protein L11 methyltransferase [Gemmatimonadaceae bacterium]